MLVLLPLNSFCSVQMIVFSIYLYFSTKCAGCRYVINFCPFDLVYKLCKFLPFKLLLCMLKEVQRSHKIYHGVIHTAKLYPNSYFLIVLIGTIKGERRNCRSFID
jgi:hypothetical protein